jgi:4-carboxymuconolactone decarboxylase
MATLPDPTDGLSPSDRAVFDHVASVRAHADGRSHQSEVYLRMFNNPGVAARVSALGEQIRFNGVLPGDVRELAILRYASRLRAGYEWSHHQRPAHLEGIDDATIAALTRGDVPADLPPTHQAVLRAVDAAVALKSIPDADQNTIINAHGTAGVVEVVAICGLYATMSYMCAAFDIEVEPGLPAPPF